MANLNSADILGVDWSRRAHELLSGAGKSTGKKEDPLPRYERVDPMAHREPIVVKEKNAVTDPDSWLNRGLGTILENAVEAVLGEGTGNAGLDMALGLTGPGAAVGTVAAGNRPGVLDMLPGGAVMKAGLVGLIKGGKQAEARAIYNILQNPIANRFANRYPEEALQSLEKFVEKHPSLKNMNTAEVYDAMGSGRLGGEWFLDLGKDYPEAFNAKNDTRLKGTFTMGSKELSMVDLAELIGRKHGKEYGDVFKNAIDQIEAATNMGDYRMAYKGLAVLERGMPMVAEMRKDLLNKPAYYAKYIDDMMNDRLRKVQPDFMYYGEPGSQDKYQELINEYLHLQSDPINWSAIADLDEKTAADIAKYGSVQAAEKARQAEQARLAMERKAASEAARESKQYEQRLRDFKKNPKKALKAANSAAPKQVRAQGDAAIREWYFGVDPIAPKTVEASPVQEIVKVVDEPASPVPVAPVPPPEPVAPVVTEVPKAPVVPEVPKGGPNKWRENGWVSTEHPVSEPGVDYSILGKDATEEDRRALFVIDSLANEAVAKLIRNNRFKDEWPGRAPLRHQGTNYDSKSRDYGMDVAWNARTGNLPRGTSALVLRNAVSSAGNRLPGQMTGVVDGKDLYDLLFRKKVDRRINELDNRYRVEF